MAKTPAELIRQFETTLRRAWQYRDEQRHRETRSAFLQLQEQKAALLELSDDAMWLRDAEAKLLILECAVLRAEGAFTASQNALSRAEALLSAVTAIGSFELNFQKAITHQIGGDYTAALHQYGLAEEKTRDPRQRQTAALNRLTCLEGLGELTEGDLQDFETRFPARVRRGEKISQQLGALRARHFFRQGQLVMATCPQKRAKGLQEKIFAEYVGQLPYFPDFKSNDTSWIARIRRDWMDEPHFFLGNYRFRTLTGELAAEDKKSYRISEFADRLYLWSWRAIAADPASPGTVLDLLSHFDFSERFPEQNAEDFQMIRNALLWLSLWDEKGAEFPLRRLESFSPHSFREAPLFGFERELIAWLRADLAGKAPRETRERLLGHPVSRKGDTTLPEILRYAEEGFLPSQGMAPLIARLRERRFRKNHKRLAIEVNPGLASVKITPMAGSASFIRSEPLALAIAALKDAPAIRCEHLMEICFKIRRYDEVVHKPKLFNLIARLRRVFPAVIRFGVKDGVVYVQGLDQSDWGELRLSGSDLSEDFRWIRFRTQFKFGRGAPAESETDRKLAQVLRRRTHFRRLDVQKILNVSRATAHRLIQAWVRSGSLQSTGASARQALYLASDAGRKQR